MSSETKITFELETPTMVKVMRSGKQIGQVWSQQNEGTTPYPHDRDAYCLNSVQICGFDRISETWACGPFSGHKDCVIHFLPTDEEYYKNKKTEYSKYIENYRGEITEMLNFKDFCATHI